MNKSWEKFGILWVAVACRREVKLLQQKQIESKRAEQRAQAVEARAGIGFIAYISV